jgi:transposase
VKTTESGGERGIDGGKFINGRKRHAITDTLGNLLTVVVNAANTSDPAGAKDAFAKLSPEVLASILKVWADGGYKGQPFASWLQDTIGATIVPTVSQGHDTQTGVQADFAPTSLVLHV